MKIVEENPETYLTKKIYITNAAYTAPLRISINFNDGKKTVVDFSQFLEKARHPSIRKYLDIEKFRKFKIVDGNLNWNDYDMIFPIHDLYEGKII